MKQLFTKFICGVVIVALVSGIATAQEDEIFNSLPNNQNQAGEQDSGTRLPIPPRQDTGPQQSVEVKEDRAGWNAAGKGVINNRLSEDLRANWVMVDANGLLLGTVIGMGDDPVDDVEVNLIQNGQVLNSTFVNERGQFSFNNVQQGTYGLVGIGKKSFFAFGFNAVRNSDNPKANAPKSITVMATPNDTTINTDWIAYFAPQVKYRVYGRFNSREGTDDPARLYGTDGISIHYPEAFPATSIQSHAVTTLDDGRLIGRVHQIDSLNGRPVDVRNIRVMLLQNDDVYAATSTDNYGVFDFTKIPAGKYSLVAAGDDGMAAIGLEVVATDAALPFEDGDDAGDKVYPIDLALVPSEASGWLLAESNEFAYQRAVSASAKFNAQRNQCNCPPTNPLMNQAVLDALRPSDRGQFWRKLNDYYDELFFGRGSGQGGANQNFNGFQPTNTVPGQQTYFPPTQGVPMNNVIPMPSQPVVPAPLNPNPLGPAPSAPAPIPSPANVELGT